MKDHSYNPDVLSCIANLSNDEVFTPPKLVNEMLDMLPSNLWKNSSATFLDPFCKSGVFLRGNCQAAEPHFHQTALWDCHYRTDGVAVAPIRLLLQNRRFHLLTRISHRPWEIRLSGAVIRPINGRKRGRHVGGVLKRHVTFFHPVRCTGEKTELKGGRRKRVTGRQRGAGVRVSSSYLCIHCS